MTNREFSTSDLEFTKACELAGLKKSTRQASKYRNKKGRAYGFKASAAKSINTEAEGEKS